MRWGKFPYPEAIAPTFDADALVNAIETEDETDAIAQVRAAIEAPDGWRLLDAPLTWAAAAHYQDFGHSMIYAYKCRQAVEALGDRVAEPIYLAYVRGLIYASREDLIPEFRAYRPAREAWNGTGAQTPMAKEFYKAGVRGAVNVANAASSDPKALFDALMQPVGDVVRANVCWSLKDWKIVRKGATQIRVLSVLAIGKQRTQSKPFEQ